MIFLIVNLALGFYLTGAVWAHEVDIFRNWKVLDLENFHRLQTVHWKKLPYWVFAPLAAALVCSIILIWHHPAGSPAWGIWGNLGCQVLADILSAIFWGPWQSKLSRDSAGSQSPYLAKFLRTHWIRTLLVSSYAFFLLFWVIELQR